MQVAGHIYAITNRVNGKRYVGKTTHPVHERWSFHVSGKNSKGTGHTLLSRAIRDETAIDKGELKQMMLDNARVEDIATYFGCGPDVVYQRVVTYFGCTVREFKKRQGIETHYNTGSKNPMAKTIDVDQIRALLEKGVTSHQICCELGVSPQKIHRTIKTAFGGNSYQVRTKWGLEIPQGPRAAKIPKAQLESLIKQGWKRAEIAQQFSVSVKAIDTRVHRYWGSSFRTLKKDWGV